MPPEKTSDDLLSTGPPPATSDSGPRPLGVPPEYVVPRTELRQERFFGLPSVTDMYFPPRYYEGHEYVPASWPTEKRARHQQLLVSVGLLDPEDAQIGVWDAKTREAYKELLSFANGAGIDETEAFQEYAKAIGAFGGKAERTRAPLVKRLANPADLKALADSVSRSVLGRKMTEEEASAFASAFQAAQAAAQQQEYDLSGAAGGTVIEPPDPEVAAEQQARATAPVEAEAHDIARTVDSFFKIIGVGGAGGVGG